MSITKGAMLISNANAVGTELVNKLGGTGYKPVEWADKINLLGISNDDKASALAGITEGTYTGDERGSIKYSNCNAVGSMLNKKFSTDRGFKPVEWESAISKLTPLAEGTVSGSVVSIENGADDVPTKSLVVTIPPSLSGVSSVTETQTGKNLLDDSQRYKNGGNIFFGGATSNTEVSLVLPAGTYTMTLKNVVNENVNLYLKDLDANAYVSGFPSYNSASTDPKSKTFTLSQETRLCAWAYNANYTGTSDIDFCQIEVGSSFASYTAYTAPTQYTASLGRTIYGGTADIVNGEGQELVEKITVSAFTGTFGAVNNGYAYYISVAGTTHNTSVVNPDMMIANQLFTYGTLSRGSAPLWQYGGNDGANTVHSFILPSEYDTLTKANNFLASLQTPLEVTLTLATPTDFTFDGQEIPTRLGVNNFWSDSGDTEVTYRKDPDIPDQPVQLLDMNNNENNDN